MNVRDEILRGNVFIYSTAAAGIALLAPDTTGNHPTIWNPAGSGYNFIPLGLTLTYVSGNNAPGGLIWAITRNAGAASGAAGNTVIQTFTDVAPVSALLGSGRSSRMRWAPAICTFAVDPVFLCGVGLSLFTGIAATAVAPFALNVDLEGKLPGVLSPGNALHLCADVATTTSLFVVSILGAELPLGA